MAAVIHLHPSDDRTARRSNVDVDRSRAAHPASQASAGRPQLRLVEGGRAPQVIRMQRVYLLRRVAVVVAAALVTVLAVQVGGAVLREWTTEPLSGEAVQLSSPYRVQAGDTLWGIARAVDPDSDPREVVDRIARANASNGDVLQAGSLQVGQELVLPS